MKFIDGSVDEVPINNNPLPAEMADIYYLIADHHFKNKTWVWTFFITVQIIINQTHLNIHFQIVYAKQI